MPTHRSREAPIPGASVSERHHGFWKDLVEREKHIRERWEVTYGGFYHQKPCSEEPYYGPIFASIPATREVNYLAENDAPKSEPMAYLRACLRKQEAAAKTMAAEGTNRKCEGMIQKYVPGQYVHDKGICSDLKDPEFQKFRPLAVKNQEYLDATSTKKLSLPSFSCQAVKLQPNNYLDIQKSTADCKANFEQYQMPPNLVKLAQGKDEAPSHPYKMSSAMYNCLQHTGLPQLSERTLCWPVQPEFPEYCLKPCGPLCGPVACSTVRTAISNFNGLGVYPYIFQRSVEDKLKTPNGQLRMHP